ncbi:hypothetical protein [Streptomyces qinglanensis]|uniref:Uncharacterized protein n=1 Tax=Streptomyces qinglanensis TaxID=943816 RepID=A0A1H9U4E6_9ACTN|nr:hypothetical protein [Streptomyces qinglanensis]SES04430.1 hypothetical protein SAMN05421870_107332 [Streptomyces qinglanensis]
MFDETCLASLPLVDQTQCEIAAADFRFHELYGADESKWFPWQRHAYRRAMTDVRSTAPEEGTTMSMPVSGPHRVYVDRIPSGVTVNLSAYLDFALRHLADECGDDLTELVEATASAGVQTSQGNDDAHAVHERDALAQSLADSVPGLDVYGRQCTLLAEQLAPEMAAQAAEAKRLRREVARLQELASRQAERLDELQQANESAYRADHDRSGGPRMGDGKHAGLWSRPAGPGAVRAGWPLDLHTTGGAA